MGSHYANSTVKTPAIRLELSSTPFGNMASISLRDWWQVCLVPSLLSARLLFIFIFIVIIVIVIVITAGAMTLKETPK